MSYACPLIDVRDVATATEFSDAPAHVGPKPEIRLPISGDNGSSTTAVHARFAPGAALGRHVHRNCDEIAILLRGRGVAGQDGERAEIRAGHCRLIPKGSERFFVNPSATEEALTVSFLIGARDLSASGFEPRGPAPEDVVDGPRAGFSNGILVHLEDVRPENMDQGDGWYISDFRLPIGAHNGATSTLFRARFLPGAVHKKHRHENCDEIYHVISGHCLAGAGPDRVEVHGGHFHFVPRGVEHWLHNLSASDPIEVVGVYVNAGSVAATGYVHTGDVTDADLERRTGEGQGP